MRNEGDQLLEAIDEAIEIGQKGGAPVHIFHLKAAGRQNWEKIPLAIAKIREARARGEQIAADVYPYVNNGLSIPALIHPKHFANGWQALRSRLDDEELRRVIREEMESDEGDWENWFKHIGRDWSKLVVGRSNSLRWSKYSGISLADIADKTEMDPWEVFFELVKTDAFVLPESMSEANKRRLISEDFISFCTDVGPYSGGNNASHPRGFGSFPRLLAKYVRDGKTTSLEQVISQATSLACNEIGAYDRGRLAEGLAADIIIFDYKTIQDNATFAKPHDLSSGVEVAIVNGAIVMKEGAMTSHLPGKVLRGPGFRRHKAPHAISSGKVTPELEEIDHAVAELIQRFHIPGGSMAITDHGRLIYARGFGYADLATREKVQPDSLFRIASISKPVTATAIFQLVDEGKLSLDDKVFTLLDGYEPPKEEDETDPRLADITILQLLQHSGGWNRNKSFDPMFRPVPFAKKLGVPPPAGPDEVIRNMLAQPLDFDPGTAQAYSNFGYCLLGRIIEKLTDSDYETHLKKSVLNATGARTMFLGRTMPQFRRDKEVRYYSPFRNGSVFAASLGKRRPSAYGCWHLEAMDSHGAWLASAIDLVRFADAFNDYSKSPLMNAESLALMHDLPGDSIIKDAKGNLKPRFYVGGWARSAADRGVSYSHGGSLPGTSTLLVRREDGRNWCVLFNSRSSRPKGPFFPTFLQTKVDAILDQIKSPAELDYYADFPEHQPDQ